MNQKVNEADDKDARDKVKEIKPKETVNGVYKNLEKLCEICRAEAERQKKTKT